MNAVYRRRLEMAARVRDFLRAHQTDGVGQGLGLAKLEELIQRAEVLAGQQRGGVAVARSASQQRNAVRRALQRKLLGYLRVVGAVAGKVNAELAQQFRMPPSNASQQALLTTGHKILERATAQKEVLVGLGMSAKATTSKGSVEESRRAKASSRVAWIRGLVRRRLLGAVISTSLFDVFA